MAQEKTRYSGVQVIADTHHLPLLQEYTLSRTSNLTHIITTMVKAQ